MEVERQLAFEVEEDPEEMWWIPLLIFIVALLIMIMFAVGFFLYKRRKEEEETLEMVEAGDGPATASRDFPGGHLELQAEPMMDEEIGIDEPISGGGLEMESVPELDDEMSMMEELSFIESVEMDDDPLISSSYHDILSREKARDKSYIQELRTDLRKRIIEEEEDEAIYFELNEILVAVEE